MPFHASFTRKATVRTATTAGLYTRKRPPEEQQQQQEQEQQQQQEQAQAQVQAQAQEEVVVVEVGVGVGDDGEVVAPVQGSRVAQGPQVGRRLGRWNIDIWHSLGGVEFVRHWRSAAIRAPKTRSLIITAIKLLDWLLLDTNERPIVPPSWMGKTPIALLRNI